MNNDMGNSEVNIGDHYFCYHHEHHGARINFTDILQKNDKSMSGLKSLKFSVTTLILIKYTTFESRLYVISCKELSLIFCASNYFVK